MSSKTKKTRPEYDADIRFRCPGPMAEALAHEASDQKRDRSDVAREIFAAGLSVYRRGAAVRRARVAGRL